MRRIIYLLSLFFLLTITGCESESNKHSSGEDHWVKITGETMGTTYSVIYKDSSATVLKDEIDSILTDFNNSLSTYIPSSLISRVNRKDSALVIDVDEYFYKVFTRSKEIHQKTSGAFDPTVMPLVNFWGFGWEEDKQIDTSALDSLRMLVQFDKVFLDMIIIPESNDTFYRLDKKLPGLQLDFSAIAKGYGVDVISQFLSNRGYSEHFVEIGGEVNTMGKYKNNAPWKVGIEKPEAGGISDRSIFTIIGLTGEAVATSGNYRNFKEVNGQKIVHTINPKSGYPEISNLLSTSVIAQDCMTADAYATAFMVMGLDSAFNLASQVEEIDAYFIYSDTAGNLKTISTDGFKKYIIETVEEAE